MEQHPVPQNVTTFQFRLIGDMTLKQFGYLCAGAILAFIAYRLPLPFLLTWPLAFAFAFLGVGFAFIPIEERPMDVWVFSFFKSVYNPTQYVWTKIEPKENPAKGAAKPAPQPPHAPPPNKTPSVSLTKILSDLWSPPKSKTPTKQVPSTLPTAEPNKSVTGYKPVVEKTLPPTQKRPPEDLAAAQQKITQLEVTLQKMQEQLAEKNTATDRVLELQKQLTDELKQKTVVENELVALKRQSVGTKSQPSQQAVPATQTAQQEKQAVRIINTQDQAVKMGLSRLTNVANVITGIIKDDAGNLLPGILVTVTDHEAIPVRALKTNKLGQFAASTPLASGTYFVEIEDPRQRFTFSRVQITLSGSVVPALEITAKSQKQLTREMLAQEIFGKNSM